MQTLENSAVAIVTVCIAAGLVVRLSPEGNLKKYLKYIVSLCVLAAILSPIAKLPDVIDLGDGFSFDYSEEELSEEERREMILNAEKEKISDAMRDLISEKWKLEKEAVDVTLTLDSDNISAVEIRRIDIKIKGEAKRDEIEKYIDEMFYGTASVSVAEE